MHACCKSQLGIHTLFFFKPYYSIPKFFFLFLLFFHYFHKKHHSTTTASHTLFYITAEMETQHSAFKQNDHFLAKGDACSPQSRSLYSNWLISNICISVATVQLKQSQEQSIQFCCGISISVPCLLRPLKTGAYLLNTGKQLLFGVTRCCIPKYSEFLVGLLSPNVGSNLIWLMCAALQEGFLAFLLPTFTFLATGAIATAFEDIGLLLKKTVFWGFPQNYDF